MVKGNVLKHMDEKVTCLACATLYGGEFVEFYIHANSFITPPVIAYL